ncbi:PETH [Symbiodinium natans]|uniref:ferredoxin--NADP(+) reductase n=1 Tax=Symbiodinium natans TaxID=878477 RepID=A0A812LBX1_9DINO|nr:PETH [Symbiodinium natans]
MDHGGKVPYIEGQSIGVIAPGPDKKGETPAKIRLYSIASSAPGDDETNKTVSLVVKRVVEVAGRGWCEYSNVPKGKDLEFPDAEKVYRGVCSSHICDLNAGDDVLITGPVGAEMLLPEDPEANMIFMATGTGIAPFRSHLRNLFNDKVSKGKFRGCAWLFLGVPFSESLLYDEEWKEMQAEFPDQFRYDYAISNEEKSEKNKINGEMWVQHKMMQYSDDLWELVKDPKTHVYMCGLKGMESGFAECFQEKVEAEGLVYTEFLKQMKKEHRCPAAVSHFPGSSRLLTVLTRLVMVCTSVPQAVEGGGFAHLLRFSSFQSYLRVQEVQCEQLALRRAWALSTDVAWQTEGRSGSRLSAHGLMASRPEIATAVAATAVGAVGIACWLKFHQPSAEQHEGEDENGQCRMGIQELSQQIQEQLKTRKPRHIDGVEPSMYKLPPFIPKSTWTVLGDELRRCETLDVTEVPGERFMTLRLDGSGFSKLTRRMTSLGVFSAGYSHEFADVMRECCQSLMTKFSGYTQSDEMTIVIPATRVVRGEQQPHSHSGRVLKICTLAAAHVTSLFNFRLQELFAAKGFSMEAANLATFDCRMGSFATLQEAMSLVLWRAADCGVNGVTDAVYKSKIPGARKIVGKSGGDKLQWLAQNGLLPLASHQAYGSFFVRSLRPHEGVNPKTGETVQTLRSSIQEVPEANVLCLAAAGELLPQGSESLDPAAPAV